MRMHNLWKMGSGLALASIAGLTLIGPVAAEDRDDEVDPLDEHILSDAFDVQPAVGKWFTTITLGVNQWPALGDLEIAGLAGDFDTTGFNLSASIHRRWRKLGRGELALGLDGGLMGHESEIRVPGDVGELTGDIMFLTPSLRWTFGKPESKRLNLEAGIGAYWGDIEEWIPGAYECPGCTQYWDSIAPGGFVGISTDLPFSKGKKGLGAMNIGARVHYAAFGDVEMLGQNIGSLSGPIMTLQIGGTYDWFAAID